MKSVFYKFNVQVLHFLAIPVFFFVFALIYNPFGLTEHLDMGRGLYSLNLSIIIAIVFLCMLVMRLVFYFLRGVIAHKPGPYILWCFAEVVVISAFVALYLALMGRNPFFSVLAVCFPATLSILVYPYAIINLSLALGSSFKGEGMQSADNASLVRFQDEHKQVRLVIAKEAVLFIKAEENYVRVYYLDAGRVKQYILRASMRSLEPFAEKGIFVRCHRSYYVNPRHIKVLRKDSGGGISAELDTDGLEAIPVSKRYYEQLLLLL